MRVLDGEQLLVRIFLGESDTWHHPPHREWRRMMEAGLAGKEPY